ncbi:hypothetical protein SESBI_02413 [Sesbania bispinosa]|nr:hypothetical protein SESBI_02413 [Sesbania bispinosa]
MAEIPVTNENPPTMEQRMERLEGSFSQILELLKTVIPEKEVINDNSNGNDNDGGGPSIKTNGENPHKVVIVTESSGPEVKMLSLLENRWKCHQRREAHGANNPHDKPKKPNFQKKEGEVHAVGTGNYPSKTISHHPVQQSSPYSLPPFYPNTPTHPILQTSTILTREEHPKLGTPHLHKLQCFLSQPATDLPKSTLSAKKERVKIDPMPIPYSDLYDTCCNNSWWPQKYHNHVSNPPPKWYNPAEACQVSYGSPGSLDRKMFDLQTSSAKVKRCRTIVF